MKRFDKEYQQFAILQQPAAKLEESPHFDRVWGDHRESPLRSTGDI
jgi:hypothetical protein